MTSRCFSTTNYDEQRRHKTSVLSRVALIALFVSALWSSGHSHGILTDPRQRGALRLDNHQMPTIDYDAPQDYSAHFPAGSKDRAPGAGTASVKRAAGNNWTPYEPLDRSFHWRAGVCGDELGAAQEHLRGGIYYYDAVRVRDYVQGSIIFMESEIVAHHNGYYEFYICNIDTCGDDISVRCFHEGHCRKLLRAPGPCDSGFESGCAPIDPMNPGRWFLPCRTVEPMMVGGWSRTLAYTLPPDLVCDHCVIQWYWTAANTCNPPGVAEYFTSPYAPHWGTCPGQGGAVGGWTSNKPTCGGPDFAEEYWQCADIRIVPNAPIEEPPPPPPPPPPSDSVTFSSAGSGSSVSLGSRQPAGLEGRTVAGSGSRTDEDASNTFAANEETDNPTMQSEESADVNTDGSGSGLGLTSNDAESGESEPGTPPTTDSENGSDPNPNSESDPSIESNGNVDTDSNPQSNAGSQQPVAAENMDVGNELGESAGQGDEQATADSNQEGQAEQGSPPNQTASSDQEASPDQASSPDQGASQDQAAPPDQGASPDQEESPTQGATAGQETAAEQGAAESSEGEQAEEKPAADKQQNDPVSALGLGLSQV